MRKDYPYGEVCYLISNLVMTIVMLFGLWSACWAWTHGMRDIGTMSSIGIITVISGFLCTKFVEKFSGNTTNPPWAFLLGIAVGTALYNLLTYRDQALEILGCYAIGFALGWIGMGIVDKIKGNNP